MLDTDLSFVYLRFHGTGGSYRGSYQDDLNSDGYAIYEYNEDSVQVDILFDQTVVAQIGREIDVVLSIASS